MPNALIRFIFLCLFCTTTFVSAQAQQPAISISDFRSMAFPDAGAFTPGDPGVENWPQSGTATVRHGYSSDEVWSRFTIQNHNDVHSRIFVVLENARIQVVDFYIQHNKPVQALEASPEIAGPISVGASLPRARHPIRFRYPIVPFNLEAGETATIFIKTKTMTAHNFTLQAMDQDHLAEYVMSSNLTAGLVYGGLLVFVLFNLLLYATFKDPGILLFCMFLALSALYDATMSGVAGTYVWPTLPELTHRAGNFLIAVEISVSAMTMRILINSKQLYPAADKFLIAMTIFFFVLAGIGMTSHYKVAQLGQILAMILFLPIGTYYALMTVWRRLENFEVILVIVGVFGFGGITSNLVLAGILDADSLVGQTVDFNIILLCGALTYLMLMRIIRIARERAEALELQVAAQRRTISFHQSTSFLVPQSVLGLMGKDDITQINLGDNVEAEITCLFLDIRSYVTISESLTPLQNIEFLNMVYGETGPIVRRHDGFVARYIGDAMLCVFPGPAGGAVAAALELQAMIARIRLRENAPDDLRVGIGLHTGQSSIAVVGESNRFEVSVFGDAVNIAARVQQMSSTLGHDIVITKASFDQLDDELKSGFAAQGPHDLTGRSDAVILYGLTPYSHAKADERMLADGRS